MSCCPAGQMSLNFIRGMIYTSEQMQNDAMTINDICKINDISFVNVCCIFEIGISLNLI